MRFGISRKGGEIRHIYKDGRDGMCGVRQLVPISTDAPTEFRFWRLCAACERSNARR